MPEHHLSFSLTRRSVLFRYPYKGLVGHSISFYLLLEPLNNLNDFERNKMLKRWALALLSCLVLTQAKPFPQLQVPPDPENVAKVDGQAVAANDCPGYVASRVFTTESSLTADLTLAGTACNIFSDDIVSLKLVVDYETGKLLYTFAAPFISMGTVILEITPY